MEGGAKITGLIDPEPQRGDPDMMGGDLSGSQLGLVQVLVVEQSDPADLRHQFPHDLDPFAGDLRRIEEYAGDIPARPIQALHRTHRNRVGFKIQRDNRDGLRRAPCRLQAVRCDRTNDVNLAVDQFAGIFRKQLAVALRGSDDQGCLLISQFAADAFIEALFALLRKQTRKQHAYPSRCARLLRLYGA